MQQLQAAASQAATEAVAEAVQELAQRLPVPASGGPAPSPLLASGSSAHPPSPAAVPTSTASVETVPIPREAFLIGTQEKVPASGGTQENVPATGGDAEPIGIHTTPETVLCQGPRLQAAAATPPHTELFQESAKRNVSKDMEPLSTCGSFMVLGTSDVMQQPGGAGSSAPAASSGGDSFIGAPPGLGGDGGAGSSAPPHPWPMHNKTFVPPASGGE